jgi:hypothetical protein
MKEVTIVTTQDNPNFKVDRVLYALAKESQLVEHSLAFNEVSFRMGPRSLEPAIAKENILINVMPILCIMIVPKKFTEEKRYQAAISVLSKRVKINGTTRSNLSD